MVIQEINGYDGRYLITTCGKVWSNVTMRWLSLPINNLGYSLVELGGKCKSVHRLVAETYLNNPDDLPAVNHIDEIKHNNDVTNLEWCTIQHNNTHSHSKVHSFMYQGEEIHVHNLAAYCRDNNLNQGNMNSVSKGRKRIAHGYTQLKQ